MMNRPPIAVHADDVHVRFETKLTRLASGGRTASREAVTVDALTGVSFTVREGDALAVIGHNGAGKTTLMSTISGVLACTQGRVLVRSQPMSLGIGSVLNPQLTGRQNVRLGLLSIGMSPQEAEEAIDEVAEFARLDEFLDAPTRTYSSGMQARLKFCIATQRQPDILLLDEALGAGDHRFKEEGMKRVNRIRENAGAIIMATHSMSEVADSCNQVLWLRDGKVEAYGTPDDVIPLYEADTSANRNTIRKGGGRKGRGRNQRRNDGGPRRNGGGPRGTDGGHRRDGGGSRGADGGQRRERAS